MTSATTAQNKANTPSSSNENDADSAAVFIANLSHTYPARKTPRKSKRKLNEQPPIQLVSDGLTTRALDSIDLTINPGEIFGLLGPNGSGKSTLFRILSTLLKPTDSQIDQSTHVKIFGNDTRLNPNKVRQSLGVVFQSPSIDDKLTARENLTHQGHLYGLSGDNLTARINAGLAQFELTERADDFVEQFSGGMQRKVEIAKALLHNPKLLLLDEPSTGLDPTARRELGDQLEFLRTNQNQTVALTTHLMEEADRCDRLAIMSKGKIVALDTPANLKAMIGGDVITLTPTIESDADADTASAARNELANDIEEKFGPWDIAAGHAPAVIGNAIRLETKHAGQFVAKLFEAFPKKFASITIGQPTLEDVFTHLTGGSLADGDA
jgi:ABC-2 type transport system ATP-binding protein